MAIDFATPITPTLFDPILKDDYIGPIRDLLNSKTVMLKRLQRKTISLFGRRGVIPVRTGRNEGMGGISAGAQLPDPGRQSYQDVFVPMVYDYLRILFDGTTVAASRGDEGAFARVLDTEITGAIIDKANEWNRVCFGNGSGRLAQINAANPAHNPAAGIYGVDNPLGFANPGPGAQHLRIGMILSVFNEAADAFRGSATVTAVSIANSTVTLSATIVGAVDNEFFYRASEDTAGVPGALPAGSWGRFNEALGIAAGISDADIPGPAAGTRTYLGISATAVPVWQATIIDNGGVAIPLDLDVLQQAEDASDQAGDGQISLWMTSYGLRRSYLNLLQANKRYINTMTLTGGFSALDFNDKPLVVDKDAPWGHLWGLDESVWAMYQHAPIHWMDDDGHILRRRDDFDSFQATLRAIFQIATTGRNRNVLIRDLLDPT